MSNEPVIETLEGLKSWFYENGMSKFTVYRGHDNTSSKRIINSKSDTVDKAWSILDKTLKDYGYRGNYYVFVTDSKTDSGGGFSTLVELYGRNDRRRSDGMNGVDGGAPNGYLTLEQAQMMIDNALTKNRIGQLEEEIEALRNGSTNKDVSPLERIFNEALQDEGSGKEMISGVKNFMSSIGIAAINFSKAFAASNGVTKGITGINDVEKMRQREAVAASKKKAAKEPTEETEYEDVTEYDQKDLDWRKAGEITERMKRLFPDNTPQNVVNALAKYLEENPHMKDIVMSQVAEKIEIEEQIPSPTDDE